MTAVVLDKSILRELVEIPDILLKFGKFWPVTWYEIIVSVVIPAKVLPLTVATPALTLDALTDKVSLTLKLFGTTSIPIVSPLKLDDSPFPPPAAWNNDLISFGPKTWTEVIDLVKVSTNSTPFVLDIVISSPGKKDPEVWVRVIVAFVSPLDWIKPVAPLLVPLTNEFNGASLGFDATEDVNCNLVKVCIS